MDRQQEVQFKLATLQMEHREMEQAISRELLSPFPDQLLVQRFKRRKLQLKDQMLQIQSELLPDIIA